MRRTKRRCVRWCHSRRLLSRDCLSGVVAEIFCMRLYGLQVGERYTSSGISFSRSSRKVNWSDRWSKFHPVRMPKDIVCVARDSATCGVQLSPV